VKILYLNHRGVLGGGEISFLQFLDHYCLRPQADIHVILGEDGELRKQLQRRNIHHQILELPAFSFRSKMSGFKALAAAELRHFNKKWAPNIIHAQTPRAAGYAARIRTNNQRTVWHLRTIGEWGFKEKWAARHTDVIVAISQAVADCVPPRLRNKVKVIYNGVMPSLPVDETLVRKWKANLSLPPDLPLIGVLGRLDDRKGLELLLNTAAALQHYQPAGWIFAGDGPRRNELITLASELKVQHIVFTGFLEETAPFWSACDIMVTASESEGFGRTVAEAVMAGCPPLYFPIDGLREMNLPTAFHLQQRQPDSLAQQIAQHLAQPQLLRQELPVLQRVFEQRFNIARHTQAINQLYRDLTN